MTDLHIHTDLSFDSEEKMQNYVRTAAANGDEALGFSEHYDYDVILSGGNMAHIPDLSAFFAEAERLSTAFPSVKILKGVELGYCAEAVPHYKALLKENSFDYAILSVHTLAGRGDCYYPEFYDGLTREQAYSSYLRAVLESVKSDLNFQIVGHIGYIARYAPYKDKRLEYKDFSELFDEILKTVIARGLHLEINTSSKGTEGDFLPDISVIERYIALGGVNFTFGSDAHSLQRYREREKLVRQFLLSHGINEIGRFEKGKPIKERL